MTYTVTTLSSCSNFDFGFKRSDIAFKWSSLKRKINIQAFIEGSHELSNMKVSVNLKLVAEKAIYQLMSIAMR